MLESDKIIRNHHIQENQEVSPFPVGDHKAARKRQNRTTNANSKYKKGSTKKHGLEWSVKLLDGLKVI